MSIAIVTGSAGLVGSAMCRKFHAEGFEVIGIDNDSRARFFGPKASTSNTAERLRKTLSNYRHYDLDIRYAEGVNSVFRKYGAAIKVVIHTAAQPSHDWSARDPQTDFGVNAVGTLNLLEAVRAHCQEAVFLFTSTNKVYGDIPNRLPLFELPSRFEVDPTHPYTRGIDELMSIDQAKHSPFGVSKTAADLMVQEYGRYFGLKSACFRCGCITGPSHAGTELHGFLAHLMDCTVNQKPYRVFGYLGKQVRDNIHSHDLAEAFWEFFKSPRFGEVYNMGGGTHCNCSVREAIRACEEITGNKLQWTYIEEHRSGDHVWWISNVGKFKRHFPNWDYKYHLQKILQEIYEAKK